MKITELRCSSCNGPLKIDEENPSIAVCEYCKSRYIIEQEENEDVTMRGPEQNWYQPREPKPEVKKTGWEPYGWKRGTALFFVMILGILLINGKGIMRRMEINRAEKAAAQAEETTEIEDVSADAAAEVIEIPELTEGFADFAAKVFGKPVDQITAEELGKIRYLEEKSTLDEIRIGYSFDNPYEKEGTEPIWITFPRNDKKVAPSQLAAFTGLKVLKIRGYISKTDIAGLELEGLGCYGKNLTEIASKLDDPGALKELEVSGGIESLEGIDSFVNLEGISLYGGHLMDLTELVKLKNLKSLKLENCDDITDFSFLSVMSQLEELYAQSEGIRDIGFVEGMANLKKLTVSHTNVLNLDGLKGRDSLTSLVVERCYEMKNCSSIGGLTNLEELSLDVPYGCEIPDLSGLVNLKALTLGGFEKTSFIRNFGALETLSIEGCGIDDPGAFSGLVNLKELKCSRVYGNTAGWKFAAQLPALVKLDLTGVATYEDISGLFGIPTLEALILNGTECEINFDKLAANPALKHLEMNGVKLYKNVKISGGGGITYVDYDKVTLDEHTDFIAAYTGLENISLTGNKLTQINFAASLPELKTLDISDNYITDLKPLELLKKLELVNCTGDPISNYQVLSEAVTVVK
ncbi:leucine-rich repeat domain-containing protein [Clostridium sp. MCC353]|uniref:leucine-rich repeat domain-containing protein n=1 Tax=Clostridium sp. MCC353 TaxID=2592646 RepID=UPI001C032391|nr:leucine-rich repeat domain-containing protein [Clostridium sp. MCC353]MBT9778980.1 leucine-rich repeat domain-containing protein [Clostridium sp. MCC353]